MDPLKFGAGTHFLCGWSVRFNWAVKSSQAKHYETLRKNMCPRSFWYNNSCRLADCESPTSQSDRHFATLWMQQSRQSLRPQTKL